MSYSDVLRANADMFEKQRLCLNLIKKMVQMKESY